MEASQVLTPATDATVATDLREPPREPMPPVVDVALGIALIGMGEWMLRTGLQRASRIRREIKAEAEAVAEAETILAEPEGPEAAAGAGDDTGDDPAS